MSTTFCSLEASFEMMSWSAAVAHCIVTTDTSAISYSPIALRERKAVTSEVFLITKMLFVLLQPAPDFIMSDLIYVSSENEFIKYLTS